MTEAVALVSDAFAGVPHIAHAFFTRQGGVSKGIYASLNGGLGSDDDRAHVIKNRARMARALGVADDALVSLHQIHSADVIAVTAPHAGERPMADALVTATPGLALAIAHADCGPVLFADRIHRVIGAAHAGWKGAFTGVLENTVSAMEKLGARRENIVASLGPTIGPKSYEVGPEFVARLTENDESRDRFFAPSENPGHALFDLPSYILTRLREAGVAAHDLALDTYADADRFFSYRRSVHRKEEDYGRLISAIALR
ncbi:MAG: polyphenol oxidase [Rhizobiales bacterium 65-9]|nr:peptidoglycan editing factor PgeF [Hyphomicrobiales bacterium]OJY32884.1 MAG: polyphenol oxidase [Rhizobiales bacterium 65-9]